MRDPRVAWVTGGASGLGRIIALRMARAGTRVALLDLEGDRLSQVASEHENLRAYPGNAYAEARIVTWVRRLAPGLLWKILHRVNR